MPRMFLILATLCLLAVPAAAQTSFQFHAAGARMPEDPDVSGWRIALFYGKNRSVSGFDLGLASMSQATDASGFSTIFGIGRVTGRSSGLAGALINIHSGEDSGLNAAFINSVKTMKSGANLGFINVTDDYSNVDISGIAVSRRSKVQVGFINVTEEIETVQIGILNFAENGIFPVMPLFNIPKRK